MCPFEIRFIFYNKVNKYHGNDVNPHFKLKKRGKTTYEMFSSNWK